MTDLRTLGLWAWKATEYSKLGELCGSLGDKNIENRVDDGGLARAFPEGSLRVA